MNTYKQLFTYTKNPQKLTAASKRNIRALIDSYRQYRATETAVNHLKLSAFLPKELSNQWSLMSRQNSAIITLSETERTKAHLICKEHHPHKKNISNAQANFKTFTDVQSFEYKGRFSGYGGSNFIPQVKSYGTIDKTGELLAVIVREKNNYIKAAPGYFWDIDEIGVKLVKISKNGKTAEYHIDSDEALSNFSNVRSQLNKMAARRKAQIKIAKEHELKMTAKIQKSTAFISLNDSIKAGNCRAGTIHFCNKVGLDATKQYLLKDAVKKVIKNKENVSKMDLERFTRLVNRIS